MPRSPFGHRAVVPAAAENAPHPNPLEGAGGGVRGGSCRVGKLSPSHGLIGAQSHCVTVAASNVHLTILALDTKCSITLNARQLSKIAEEMKALRRSGGVSYRELEQVASLLGRSVRSTEGSHGQWTSIFAGLRPVTILRHRGDISRWTKNAILDALMEDVEMWEMKLAEEESR